MKKKTMLLSLGVFQLSSPQLVVCRTNKVRLIPCEMAGEIRIVSDLCANKICVSTVHVHVLSTILSRLADVDIMRRSNRNFNIPPTPPPPPTPPGKPRAFDYFLCPGVGNLTGKAFQGVGNLTLPGWGGEN